MSDTHLLISARAYEIWENEGRPQERSGAHWIHAERDVLAELAKPIAQIVKAAGKTTAPKAKRAPRKAAAPRRARKAA